MKVEIIPVKDLRDRIVGHEYRPAILILESPRAAEDIAHYFSESSINTQYLNCDVDPIHQLDFLDRYLNGEYRVLAIIPELLPLIPASIRFAVNSPKN